MTNVGSGRCAGVSGDWATLSHDEAFAWLERAIEERDASLVFWKIEPRFDERFRADARYRALLRRVGLR